MPIFESMPSPEKIDCSVDSQRSSSLLCRLLPLGLHYDVSQVETGDGKETVRVLFSTQSSDAIVYVTIVVLIYITLFIGLVITSYRKNVERVKQRRRKRRAKQPANTVVEIDNSGSVKCLTNETICEATCV